MTVHDALRFARRPRCIDDFDDVVRGDRAGFEESRRRETSQQIQHGRIDDKFRFGFCLNAANQIRRESVIHGHRLNSASHACPEHSDPFQTILRPDQYPVAFAGSALIEVRHDRGDRVMQFGVSRDPRSQSIGRPDCFTVAEPRDFG